MGDTFPVLKATLGEPAFSGFVFAYLQEYPSRSYTLSKLGENFVRFLETTRPNDSSEQGADGDGSLPPGWPHFLIDLARFEWTIAEVFDAPGTERIQTLEDVTAEKIGSADFGALRFTMAPNLRLLTTRFPLNDYYTSVRRAPEGPTVPPAPATSYIAVTRRDYIVRRHDLDHTQYILLTELQRGRRLIEALERAASVCEVDDDQLAARLSDWFEYWIRNQFIVGIDETH